MNSVLARDKTPINSMYCFYVINNRFFILVDWCLYERLVQPSAEEHVVPRGEREMVYTYVPVKKVSGAVCMHSPNCTVVR